MTEKVNKSQKPKRKSSIKFTELEKQYKKLNEYSTYTVDEELNKVIKYYAQFDVQKIQELLKELNEHMVYANENKIEFFTNDDTILKYVYYLICKHFSHFKDEIGTQFETNIQAMNMLISLGYFKLFFTEIFDNEEVLKVIDAVNEMVDLASKQIIIDDATKEKLANIQNKDILFKKDKIIPEV